MKKLKNFKGIVIIVTAIALAINLIVLIDYHFGITWLPVNPMNNTGMFLTVMNGIFTKIISIIK
jgi:hypothetical protein